jgi:serine/threonine-protein kinase HipA
MVCDSMQGWRLSKAFDLVPDIGQRGEHVLFFDLDAVYPGRANFWKLGQSWGISGAVNIVDQVFSAVADWRQEFKACGVASKDIKRFSEIDDYLQR